MKTYDGVFSANLMSLQLQLSTLLEDVGGEDTTALLDSMATLGVAERRVLLQSFKRVVQKIAAGPDRLLTSMDVNFQEFEDALYKDVLESMREAADEIGEQKLAVVPGGKRVRGVARGVTSTPRKSKSKASRLHLV